MFWEQEAARLARIEDELERLRLQEAEGINSLRDKLEQTDRELLELARDFEEKKTLYLSAKELLEHKRAEKVGIQVRNHYFFVIVLKKFVQ
jgi:hypothetical protein